MKNVKDDTKRKKIKHRGHLFILKEKELDFRGARRSKDYKMNNTGKPAPWTTWEAAYRLGEGLSTIQERAKRVGGKKTKPRKKA